MWFGKLIFGLCVLTNPLGGLGEAVEESPHLVWSPSETPPDHAAFQPPSFLWKEVSYNFSITSGMEALQPSFDGAKAEHLLGGQKLYVVVATIAKRIKHVAEVINNILNGAAVPTHLYLMLSDHKFMLDSGLPAEKLPVYLKFLAYTGYLTIVYTENIGPHRKLLPILSRIWNEDAVIVTFDDDRRVPRDSLLRLIKYYLNSERESVVGLRVRRIGFCATYSYDGDDKLIPSTTRKTSLDPSNVFEGNSTEPLLQRKLEPTLDRSRTSFDVRSGRGQGVGGGGGKRKKLYRLGMTEYGACRWPRVQNRYVTREMMALPTGNGGVLYRPRFFHPIVFDSHLRELTQWNDDLTFRLATMLKGTLVIPGCCDDDFNYCQDLFASMKDAIKRKSSLYDQNQARNSLMWRAALTYLRNHSATVYTMDFGDKFDIFSLVKEFLPHERSTCGIDRDSPLKNQLHERRRRRKNKGDSSKTDLTLKNLVGILPLLERQRKALKKEGNKCGIHWCSAKEKQFNSESKMWIDL